MDSIPIEDRAALWPLIEEILLDHHPYSEVPLPIPPFLCFPKVTLCWLLPTSKVNVSQYMKGRLAVNFCVWLLLLSLLPCSIHLSVFMFIPLYWMNISQFRYPLDYLCFRGFQLKGKTNIIPLNIVVKYLLRACVYLCLGSLHREEYVIL